MQGIDLSDIVGLPRPRPIRFHSAAERRAKEAKDERQAIEQRMEELKLAMCKHKPTEAQQMLAAEARKRRASKKGDSAEKKLKSTEQPGQPAVTSTADSVQQQSRSRPVEPGSSVLSAIDCTSDDEEPIVAVDDKKSEQDRESKQSRPHHSKTPTTKKPTTKKPTTKKPTTKKPTTKRRLKTLREKDTGEYHTDPLVKVQLRPRHMKHCGNCITCSQFESPGGGMVTCNACHNKVHRGGQCSVGTSPRHVACRYCTGQRVVPLRLLKVKAAEEYRSESTDWQDDVVIWRPKGAREMPLGEAVYRARGRLETKELQQLSTFLEAGTSEWKSIHAYTCMSDVGRSPWPIDKDSEPMLGPVQRLLTVKDLKNKTLVAQLADMKYVAEKLHMRMYNLTRWPRLICFGPSVMISNRGAWTAPQAVHPDAANPSAVAAACVLSNDATLGDRVNATTFWNHPYTAGGLGSEAYPQEWLSKHGLVRPSELQLGDILAWPSDLMHCKPRTARGRVVLYCMFRPADSPITPDFPYYNWLYLARRVKDEDTSEKCHDLFKRAPMALCTGYSTFTERLMTAWKVYPQQQENLLARAGRLLALTYDENNIGTFQPTVVGLPEKDGHKHKEFRNTVELELHKKAEIVRLHYDTEGDPQQWREIIDEHKRSAEPRIVEISVPAEKPRRSSLKLKRPRPPPPEPSDPVRSPKHIKTATETKNADKTVAEKAALQIEQAKNTSAARTVSWKEPVMEAREPDSTPMVLANDDEQGRDELRIDELSEDEVNKLDEEPADDDTKSDEETSTAATGSEDEKNGP